MRVAKEPGEKEVPVHWVEYIEKIVEVPRTVVEYVEQVKYVEQIVEVPLTTGECIEKAVPCADTESQIDPAGPSDSHNVDICGIDDESPYREAGTQAEGTLSNPLDLFYDVCDGMQEEEVREDEAFDECIKALEAAVVAWKTLSKVEGKLLAVRDAEGRVYFVEDEGVDVGSDGDGSEELSDYWEDEGEEEEVSEVEEHPGSRQTSAESECAEGRR